MKVYLCGPINGRSDADCNDWRQQATALLAGHEVLDPMRRDFRGMEELNAAEIVEGDKADIAECDALLVWFDRPSVGTSMEVLLAWQTGKPVAVVNGSGKPPSPWLVYHATSVSDTLEQAVASLGCTSGAAPLAGAVRPDEKTGPGGSAPAPVPAGDAGLQLALIRRIVERLSDSPMSLIDNLREALSLPEWDHDKRRALSKQVPAGDAVALAAHVVKLYKAAYAAERLLLRAIAAKGEGRYSYIQARDGAMLEATATINALRDAMGGSARGNGARPLS